MFPFHLFIYLFSYVSENPLNEKIFKFHFKKFLQLVPNLIITFVVFVLLLLLLLLVFPLNYVFFSQYIVNSNYNSQVITIKC